MSTITAEQEQAIADLLARTPHLAVGMGTETRPCSVAAINLALTGSLTGAIPECMSQVIGFWIRSAQDAAPADICRDHPRWRELLPLAAGTGREHEVERCSTVLAWMWDVLALPEVVEAVHGAARGAWDKMLRERTPTAASAAAADLRAAAYDRAPLRMTDAARSARSAASASGSIDIMSHAVRAAASAAYAAGYGARARAAWRAADPVALLERLIAVGRPA